MQPKNPSTTAIDEEKPENSERGTPRRNPSQPEEFPGQAPQIYASDKNARDQQTGQAKRDDRSENTSAHQPKHGGSDHDDKVDRRSSDMSKNERDSAQQDQRSGRAGRDTGSRQ